MTLDAVGMSMKHGTISSVDEHQPLIELDQVTVKYTGRKHPTIENLSLNLDRGETVLLLGASGCGKSTLALTLNGLIPHALGATLSGHVRVHGMDTQTTTVANLARHVGIVFQDPEAQFVTLVVEDELTFGLENLCVAPEQMDGAIRRALANVGMATARHQRVDRLSGGQKQRIALAALLALDSQILVFDEPTAHLDPVGTRDVFALLAEIKAQRTHTLILIEHKLDELMHLIDRVVVLGFAGDVLADGSPIEVFRDHVGLLQQHGVWMPQVCTIAHRLLGQGIAFDRFPVTLEDAFEQLVIRDVQLPNILTQPVLPTATDRPCAIEIRNLSFGYGSRHVLDQVSLGVPAGDFLAIVGANGAGKTTLAQLLVGILPAPRGLVWIGGRDVTTIPARTLMTEVGYVFQNPEHQFITDSVRDEVAYGLNVLGLDAAAIEERTTALLDRFGLSRYAKANPFTLSHGEKRRLSVATILAMGQRILILDEPTFGQDQRNATEMMNMLKMLHGEGRTIVIVTHDMTLVEHYAEHVAVLCDGRLLFHGGPSDLFAQPGLLASARLTPPPLVALAARLASANGELTSVPASMGGVATTPLMPHGTMERG